MNNSGDVLLYQSVDGGDINVVGGITELTGGFDTALYLSLFGGNFKDNGSQDNRDTWWGNLLETAPEKKYVSRTQNILRGLPATAANLRRLEEAARLDLQWLTDIGAATGVEVSASIPEYGEVLIGGSVTADGEKIPFKFALNWSAAQSEA